VPVISAIVGMRPMFLRVFIVCCLAFDLYDQVIVLRSMADGWRAWQPADTKKRSDHSLRFDACCLLVLVLRAHLDA
jgi:uncharacterized membrane protein YobD (UPF0266 family)